MTERKVAVVFIHGLFSGPKTWGALKHLLECDRDLVRQEISVDLKVFSYDSPKFSLNPLRRIPNLNDIAESLKSYLEIECEEHDALVLVSHSQGGLVLQRYLQRMLNDGRGLELKRIKNSLMFACPNSGSELFLLLRKWVFFFFPHSQAKELGMLNDAIAEAQRKVIHNVVRASTFSATECRIPVFAYFGQTDNIVRPVSAMGLFLDTGSMPGDHFTIIQPDDSNALVFKTIKRHLLVTCQELKSHVHEVEHTSVHPETTLPARRHPEQPWAFAWASDSPSRGLGDVVASAVRITETFDSAAKIFSLRVDTASKEVNGEAEHSAIENMIRQSRISIVISDDPASSYTCLKLLRATIEAEKRVYILSQREISHETKMEILTAGDGADVELRICEPGRLQDEIIRVLRQTGPKTGVINDLHKTDAVGEE
ncbi:esterase/lipase family protein [Streptomyces olivaceus]|uniref:esterase/lipase family protein n=1 Tax=Streptomyces olivaceus TaxID=47716 RepID=UPI0033B42A45